MVKYNDYPMTQFLMAESSVQRLDRYPLLYGSSGKARTRVAITALDVTTNQRGTVLFRNYTLKDQPGERITGTERAYLWEALRATTAATSYFAPYSRGFAPLVPPSVETDTPWYARGYSFYLHGSAGSFNEESRYQKKLPLFTHKELLRHAKPEDTHLIEGDAYLNSGTILVDGGIGKNNPILVGMLEMQRIYPHEDVDVFVSISTGTEASEKEHEAWNVAKTPAPLDAPLLFSSNGAPKVTQVMRELIQITLAAPVTETQDTNAIAECTIKRFASFVRLNPVLKQKTELDKSDSATIAQLVKDTEEWCTSPAGAALIRRCAREILQ
jgi:hypothetical protein